MDSLRDRSRVIVGSALFDADWYFRRYPDVTLLGMDAAEHYLQVGASLGRDPGPDFSAGHYLRDHPDVAAAGVDPLVHYERSGRREGRRITPAASPAKALPGPDDVDRESSLRDSTRDEAQGLGAGAGHYTAYVGPPRQYDFMGATQFRLLTSLGLRDTHHVLDIGCGSLRAGRLLIPYLRPDRYCGIEPNNWLVDDALDNELGRDIVRIKRPRFDDNADFRANAFGTEFDFAVAQSIFSHATPRLVAQALANTRSVLAPSGIIACTFIESEDPDVGDASEDWIYPACVTYSPVQIAALFEGAGLAFVRLRWFHPRQTWYLAAADASQLPTETELPLLQGEVLRDAELRASVHGSEPMGGGD